MNKQKIIIALAMIVTFAAAFTLGQYLTANRKFSIFEIKAESATCSLDELNK